MLGFILAPLGQEVPGQYPNEINYAYGGTGSYLCPPDPQFNTRGEQGYYYDTPLGGLDGPAIPTDAELAQNYGYTPVEAAWINAKEGFIPGPWRVPGGWNPAGKYGPPRSLSGSFTLPNWSIYTYALLAAAGYGAWRLYKKKRAK